MPTVIAASMPSAVATISTQVATAEGMDAVALRIEQVLRMRLPTIQKSSRP